MATKLDRLGSSIQSAQERLDRAKRELARRTAAFKQEQRRRDTRWKIVVGGAALARARSDEGFRSALDTLLDRGLRSGRDRALLEEWRRSGAQASQRAETGDSLPVSAPADGEPLPGFKPHRLPGGGWGAVFRGPADSLPAALAGVRIEVAPRRASPWVSTVVEVLERTPERVVVRDSGKPRDGA